MGICPKIFRMVVNSAVLACSVVAGAIAQAQAPVTVAVPGNVYAALEKSLPRGVVLETLDAVLRPNYPLLGYSSMPTSDGILGLSNGGVDIVAVAVRTPKLDELAWLSDPVVTEVNVIVTPRDKTFALNSESDLNGKTIAGREGYRYPYLEGLKSTTINRYRTDAEMLRAMFFGNVQAAVIGGVSDLHALRAEGVMNRLEVLNKSVGAVPLVVAFSKKRFTQDDVARFNQQLAQFKLGSEWQAIVSRNGMTDLLVPWRSITD